MTFQNHIWLILTDREYVVFAEGFSLDELDKQIETKKLRD